MDTSTRPTEKLTYERYGYASTKTYRYPIVMLASHIGKQRTMISMQRIGIKQSHVAHEVSGYKIMMVPYLAPTSESL